MSCVLVGNTLTWRRSAMSSLKADFDELRERIRHGRELGHASFEPIYYLVFDPKLILEVKRQTPAWIAKLHQEGWEVHTFSIAEQIWQLLKDDPFWSLCVMEDKSAPLDWSRTNKALADILMADNALLKRLEATLEPLEGKRNALLLVTDLEALHPFLRIGAIDCPLQGKFHVPTVFLYPGGRTGPPLLDCLRLYPEGGNYRSVHVEGFPIRD